MSDITRVGRKPHARIFVLANEYKAQHRWAAPSGGARRDRTDDLLLAKQALSQLSYGPFRGQGISNRQSESRRRHAAVADNQNPEALCPH
jgi:hypothetical protein